MTGVRRALLVGSQTGKLKGVDSDVERMGEALTREGFTELTVCTGAKAERDGILAAYQRLIDDSRRDDTVCVYYSGHGNLAPNPHYQPGNRTPPVLQYIIPTDDSPDRFRGIMNFELSLCLARLTEQTRNVTVILDCCHSAFMSRAAQDLKLLPKGGASRVTDQALAELLKNTIADEALLAPESNPHAVRLVAAEAHSLAFERIDESGRATGAFTEALLQVLAGVAGERVSWNTLMLPVRELVMSRIPDQHPNAEGPRRRRMWELEQVADERPLSLFFEGKQAKLRGGTLLGVVPGATYGVMPSNAEAYASERSLGTAVVEESLGSLSRVRLEPPPTTDLPRTGLLAFPLSVPFRKCPVALTADADAALRARIGASHFLTPTSLSDDQPMLSVVDEAGALVVHDALGDLLLRTTSLDDGLGCLERVARAEDLRRLELGQLDASLDVSFGRVVNGRSLPMQEGELLYAGDRQFISVENAGFEPTYVAVLGIDVAYDVQMLLRRAPRGYRLAATQRFTVGEDARGVLTGLELSWPESLPRDRPRRESLIIIAADAEQDFTLLTTPSQARGGAASALERRLQQIRGGAQRTRGAQASGGSEYLLRRIDYQFAPGRRDSP